MSYAFYFVSLRDIYFNALIAARARYFFCLSKRSIQEKDTPTALPCGSPALLDIGGACQKGCPYPSGKDAHPCAPLSGHFRQYLRCSARAEGVVPNSCRCFLNLLLCNNIPTILCLDKLSVIILVSLCSTMYRYAMACHPGRGFFLILVFTFFGSLTNAGTLRLGPIELKIWMFKRAALGMVSTWIPWRFCGT